MVRLTHDGPVCVTSGWPAGWLANTVKSLLGLYNFIRGFKWAYKRGVYIRVGSNKRNKKNVSERRDKTYLRNELKLTYHYILSYIYNTFIVRHNKRRTYLKNVYKTDLCDWNNSNFAIFKKRNAKGTRLYIIRWMDL